MFSLSTSYENLTSLKFIFASLTVRVFASFSSLILFLLSIIGKILDAADKP